MSKTCSLFSGSSGNSIYVGCGDNQILVDIGVSARRCEQKLRQVGADPAEIKGIFVTHEHGDMRPVCGCLPLGIIFRCLPIRRCWSRWRARAI